MDNEQKVSRRKFLRISAFTAVSATVVACGGQPAAPAAQPEATAAPATAAAEAPAVTAAPAAPDATAAPAATQSGVITGNESATTAPIAASGNYKEAPQLAALVEAGDLPPVDQRLPKNPYVPPHQWLTTGNYGGTMQLTNSWGEQGVSTIVVESMYGHSPLRWLRDGLEIGPGLAESWSSNAETTEWTLKFREGLKWSDGQDWTVDDILYWWEDLVNVTEANEAPPDEARSGTGTLATFTKVDDYTLKLTYDAPAPLTADRIAMWVNNGGSPAIGPRWMAPKHYMQQFHPKYNQDVKDFEEHTRRMDSRTNPEYPVLTGWKLKEYNEGASSVWERNPYYWCVDKDGNQLPYIDAIQVTGYQDKEVEKVNYLQGKFDFTHHWVVTLSDVAAANQGKAQGDYEIRFWDGGDGTGNPAFFFNYDYKDPKLRELVRIPKFRKALSHAYNRAAIHRDFFFNRGEPTTGTYSPKAIEYNFNDEAKQRYAEWRDSALKYDPELAKSLLDEVGVKAGPDGMRTQPDGSPLTITLDYAANDQPRTISINERLAADWKAIGIDARLNPMTPGEGMREAWKAGDKFTNANWGIGDGPNHLVFPQWLVPIEFERWAPLQGTFYLLRGTEQVGDDLTELAEPDTDPYERTPPRMKPEDGSPVARLWEIYDRSRVEIDPIKRHQLVWEMIKVHVEDGPFVQGLVANAPNPIIVKNGLMNVPQREDLALGGFTNPWIHPTPAVYDPETWFWDNPEAHT